MEDGADTSHFHGQASEIGSTPDIDANRLVGQCFLPQVGRVGDSEGTSKLANDESTKSRQRNTPSEVYTLGLCTTVEAGAAELHQ